MPAYQLKVTLTFIAKRDDSGDASAAILRAIDAIPNVSTSYDYEVNEVDTPIGPDEDGA